MKKTKIDEDYFGKKKFHIKKNHVGKYCSNP
jgi:hypothetical protein